MAFTTIDDLLHAPVQILVKAIRERQPRRNSIMTSPLVIRDSAWANRAVTEGGTSIEIPLIKPVPGGYTLQNPGTPATVDALGSAKQTAAVCYREKAWGRDAFAAGMSGVDPLNWLADAINNVRFDKQEAQIIAMLLGIFKSTGFTGLNYNVAFSKTVNEAPVGVPASNLYWDTDVFHDTVSILDIREDDLRGGVMFVHPKHRTYLKKADELDTVKASTGDFLMETYKGLRVVVDNRLVRAGTTSGFVYRYFIAAPGSVIVSQADQSGDGTTVSSLAPDVDVPNLRKALWDRITDIVHVNGCSWSPATAQGGALTVAKGGPTDAQFATQNAWVLKSTSAGEVKVLTGEVNV